MAYSTVVHTNPTTQDDFGYAVRATVALLLMFVVILILLSIPHSRPFHTLRVPEVTRTIAGVTP